MLSLKTSQNADAATTLLLKNLQINIGADQIAAELEKHPDYPGLLAISDVLTSFKIENSAYRVEPDQVQNIPPPFIAHTNLNHGEFVVVNSITGDNIFISGDRWRNKKLTLDSFKAMFSGVVLTVDAVPEIKKSLPSFKTFKTPFAIALTMLILASALVFNAGYFTNLSWGVLLFSLVKTIGLIASILLLIQSVDHDNPLVQALCQPGGKTNCEAILSSKAAKIFDGFSWSEAGFFYFAGTWLLLLFGGNNVLTWALLALLNLIGLPYTFYSIYYQARVARQWCTLCCSVQAVLWMEFLALMLGGHSAFRYLSSASFIAGITYAQVSIAFICLLSPVVLWILLKPLFLGYQQLSPLRQQLRTFKYNSQLFNKMLRDQPKYTQPEMEWSIVLGDAEASNVITMVSNPYCPPCAKAHKLLDQLLEERNDVQARIIFSTKNSDTDIATPISRHLATLNELNDAVKIKQALNDWYGQKQKNYEAWARLYPVALNGAAHEKIEKQKEWCQLAEITSTPTLLVNGYKLPQLYKLTDLKYMLE